jgi:hypothetical protein
MGAKKKANKKKGAKKLTSLGHALMAASGNEGPDDAKHDAILNCIVSVFTEAGFGQISAPDAKVVWSTIDDDDVLLQLGNGIRDCIIGKGFQCQGLAPEFFLLRNANKITPVSVLVNIIAMVVTS